MGIWKPVPAPWKFTEEKGWHRDLDALEWFFRYGDHLRYPSTDRWETWCPETGYHWRPVIRRDGCVVKMEG